MNVPVIGGRDGSELECRLRGFRRWGAFAATPLDDLAAQAWATLRHRDKRIGCTRSIVGFPEHAVEVRNAHSMITTLNIGYLRADLSAWYGLPADHPSAGQVDALPMFCYHIALATRSVLVDAPAYEFTDEFADFAIPGRQAPPLLDQLAGANIDAADVTDVIITHAHFDHYNGLTCVVDGRYVPAFPNARHYLGAGDWQPETFGPSKTTSRWSTRQVC